MKLTAINRLTNKPVTTHRRDSVTSENLLISLDGKVGYPKIQWDEWNDPYVVFIPLPNLRLEIER